MRFRMFAKAALLLLLSVQIAAAAMDAEEVRGLVEKMASDEYQCIPPAQYKRLGAIIPGISTLNVK